MIDLKDDCLFSLARFLCFFILYFTAIQNKVLTAHVAQSRSTIKNKFAIHVLTNYDCK